MKRGGGEFRSRIASRFFQLFEDVGHGRQPELCIDISFRPQRFQQATVAHDFFHVLLNIAKDFLHQRIRFRMHGRRVERIVAMIDAQKSGALLERFFAQTRHRFQRNTRSERAIRVAVLNDVCRHRRCQARYVRQQRNRGGIHIHTNRIHTVFHDGLQRTRELCLVHVVLILPDADGFWIDFHQFGQRILQASCNRHGTA